MTESTPPRKKLEGKVAIITGGASGIGEATARVFANDGARAIVIVNIQDDLGQQVAASIGTDKCKYMHCDVTDEDQVKTLVDSTLKNYDRLDIMFNNAGIFTGGSVSVLDLDFSAFDPLFAIKVCGMAACVKHVARATRGTDYCMSKHAVLGLVTTARAELGVHGIRLNSISPYAVASPTVCSFNDMEMEEVEKFYGAYTSLKGIVLKGKHIGEAVSFLASKSLSS